MSQLALINQLKKKHPKLNKNQIETIFNVFFQTIENAIKNKRTVELRGFGTFFIKKIKEKYSARNPKTDEIIYVPEKNKIRVRVGKKFKQFLNK